VLRKLCNTVLAGLLELGGYQVGLPWLVTAVSMHTYIALYVPVQAWRDTVRV